MNEIILSRLKIINNIVTSNKKKLSLLNIFSFVSIVNNKVPIARINPMFAMLLPTMFPIINPDSFEIEAEIDVASSGNEVPIETRVNPMTNSLTPMCLASLAEFSTKKLAPLIRTNNENINIKRS